MRRAVAAAIMWGQRSASMKAASAGCQWSRKRAVASGVSAGRNWWMTRGMAARATAAPPVAVVVVTRSVASGGGGEVGHEVSGRQEFADGGGVEPEDRAGRAGNRRLSVAFGKRAGSAPCRRGRAARGAAQGRGQAT